MQEGFIIAKNYRVLKHLDFNNIQQMGFYHSEKLQSTKTIVSIVSLHNMFYHSEKLQSTKTVDILATDNCMFYHSEKLQSTKTWQLLDTNNQVFYHSEKLQSTKTSTTKLSTFVAFRYNKSINKKSTDHKTRAQNFTQKH